ncbi:MAG: citrate transporter, partial [Bacteroidota bacterium]|nr:citrate transporter [Bacteroidota bacterium]
MKIFRYVVLILLLFVPSSVFAGSINSVPCVGGIRLEFILFGLTLVGVAVFQKKTMQVALLGLFLIIGVKLLFVPDFSFVHHFLGDGQKTGEWHILLNLLGLLLGFAILARHFEESKLPDILPNYLPDDWKGGFVLLLLVMFLATFLDSIASAMIGGAIAFIVFKG